MIYSDFTREQYDAMNIFELRHIGREIGVKSPTSKSKGELIDSIMERIEEIKTGKITPDDLKKSAQKGRGRPPKSIMTLHYTMDPIKALRDKDGPSILDGVLSSPEEAFPVEDSKPSAGVAAAKEKPEESAPKSEVKNNNWNKKEHVEEEQPVLLKEGVLEIMPDGYGFLRAKNCEPGEGDAYVAAQRIKKWGLRKGDFVKAEARQQTENRPAGVFNILSVNGKPVNNLHARRNFDSLTPIYPDHRFRLEIPNAKNDFAIRAIDLVAPIGKGQRAMIVSPPKAGKTTLLKKIAHSISKNYPKVHLMVLLIDERPEEVTDMQRSIQGEVIYSTFDETPEHHTKAAELVLERAKRLVEIGEDVVILMDSLTRLARAYNLVIAPTGRTLSGGIDPGALHNPKRFFGAARNIEDGGSLTIIATALVDTGSRMDDVIYEEFKGTGNMEIHLDRKLSEKRIFPAIDLNRSGTRREELLLDQKELEGIWGMRKMFSNGETADTTEMLINMLIKTSTNREFIEQLNMQLMALQKKGYTIR
ncbi:MAG TPA: transcription termination factor Rho [Clostridiales bacterium]|jgi:transcription termination factor Rho|nr:transcription termination factor Rho [Clostridiales bacterium]